MRPWVVYVARRLNSTLIRVFFNFRFSNRFFFLFSFAIPSTNSAVFSYCTVGANIIRSLSPGGHGLSAIVQKFSVGFVDFGFRRAKMKKTAVELYTALAKRAKFV